MYYNYWIVKLEFNEYIRIVNLYLVVIMNREYPEHGLVFHIWFFFFRIYVYRITLITPSSEHCRSVVVNTWMWTLDTLYTPTFNIIQFYQYNTNAYVLVQTRIHRYQSPSSTFINRFHDAVFSPSESIHFAAPQKRGINTRTHVQPTNMYWRTPRGNWSGDWVHRPIDNEYLAQLLVVICSSASHKIALKTFETIDFCMTYTFIIIWFSTDSINICCCVVHPTTLFASTDTRHSLIKQFTLIS